MEVTTSRTIKTDRWVSLQSAAKKLRLDGLVLIYDGFVEGAAGAAEEKLVSRLLLSSFLLEPECILEIPLNG